MSQSDPQPGPPVFDQYAHYYDLLYQDKDYPREARFVSEHLTQPSGVPNRLLELGCGTGRHALEFARLGWNVAGVDLSPDMVRQARDRAQRAPVLLSTQVEFHAGDVRHVRTGAKYDAVASLFHVASYQTTNADLTAMIATASLHLNQGGRFFFDFWYGPAVLSDPPVVRVKRLSDQAIQVTRLAEPEVFSDRNRVDVNYEISIKNLRDGSHSHVHESHAMRYLFLPELEQYLSVAGFKLRQSGSCYTGHPLDRTTWYGWILAEKI